MQLLFYGEARKYNALPIDSNKVSRLDVGSDAGEPVSEDYRVLFDFKGKLNKVQVELDS